MPTRLLKHIFNITINSKYHITSTGWENAGDGINPDGTKAHIGVYGGLFAWGTKVVEITPTNNTLKVISWSTMDNNIAMISNKGKVVGYIYIRVRS